MTTPIIFLRHAQSIFNRDLISEKNCSLSEFGKEQAAQLTGDYDIIICSILKRARETLQYSQLTAKKLYFTDLCREVRVDICDFLENENETDLESEEEITKRIKQFKQYLKEKTEPGQKVLVICHRDFIHHIGHKKYPEPKNAEFQTIQLE
jgi:broad specificity phosphatase PhoE